MEVYIRQVEEAYQGKPMPSKLSELAEKMYVSQ